MSFSPVATSSQVKIALEQRVARAQRLGVAVQQIEVAGPGLREQ